MTFGTQIASQLKRIRLSRLERQDVVAKALNLSVSAVSRLERGHRSLQVDALVAWAGALGHRIDVILWQPATSDECWIPEHIERAMGLDESCASILSEVAASVNHMPEPARRVLIEKMRTWKRQAPQIG